MRELLRRIDSAELTEWHCFAEGEPFGDEWRQTGTLAALLANTDVSGPQQQPEDFMPIAKPVIPGRDFLYFQAFATQHNAILALK